MILRNKYEIDVTSIEKAFQTVVLEYLDSFAKIKNTSTEILLKQEQWKTIEVLPYFQNIIRVTNDLQISDEDFFNVDSITDQEASGVLVVDGQNFQVVNSI